LGFVAGGPSRTNQLVLYTSDECACLCLLDVSPVYHDEDFALI